MYEQDDFETFFLRILIFGFILALLIFKDYNDLQVFSAYFALIIGLFVRKERLKYEEFTKRI